MKKYVALIVCSVLLIIAMLMGSATQSDVILGRGNGIDARVATVEQFVDVLDFFTNYKIKSTDSASVEDGVSTFASKKEESKYTSATFYNKSKMTSNYSSSFSGASSTTNLVFNRELTIYLTETSAYYDSIGKVMQSSTQTYQGETKSYSSYMDFDMEIYMSAKKCYIKFNKFDMFASGDGASSNENIIKPEMLGKWFDGDEIGSEFLAINQQNYAILEDLGDYFEDYRLSNFNESNGVYKLKQEYLQEVFAVVFGVPETDDMKGEFSLNLSNKVRPTVSIVQSYSASNYNDGQSVSNSAYSQNNMVFSNINNTVINFKATNIYDLEDYIDMEDFE